jgi:hypothetical protein
MVKTGWIRNRSRHESKHGSEHREQKRNMAQGTNVSGCAHGMSPGTKYEPGTMSQDTLNQPNKRSKGRVNVASQYIRKSDKGNVNKETKATS